MNSRSFFSQAYSFYSLSERFSKKNTITANSQFTLNDVEDTPSICKLGAIFPIWTFLCLLPDDFTIINNSIHAGVGSGGSGKKIRAPSPSPRTGHESDRCVNGLRPPCFRRRLLVSSLLVLHPDFSYCHGVDVVPSWKICGKKFFAYNVWHGGSMTRWAHSSRSVEPRDLEVLHEHKLEPLYQTYTRL